jgi:hypothetical protein
LHLVVFEVLQDWPVSEKEAAARARRWFQAQGPRLAAPLFLPGAKARRAALERMLAAAVRALVRLLHAAGLAPEALEQTCRVRAPELGLELEGRPDLVAGGAVLDLKRGGLGFWRHLLAQGGAVQLAAYGRILAGRSWRRGFPPAGIFVLEEARLLSLEGETFPEAWVVEGPSLEETWQGVAAALEARREELSQGEVWAPGVTEECPEETALYPDMLEMEPPCGLCPFWVICGLAWEEEG